MKKILALVMTLVLMCGMLMSCDNARALLEKADAALKKEPYAITTKMDFKCDNAELNQIFSLMNIEIPAIIDGENVTMDIGMDMMGYSVNAKAIVADMVLYYDIDVLGQGIKMKAAMNEDQYQEFMGANDTHMAVKSEDFDKLTVETKDGKKHISCEEITEDGLEVLNDLVEESLDNANGEATVSDVTYVIILNNGKYESMNMTCVYSVTVAGETYNVTLNLSTEFSYDNIAKVTAPADADQYQEVSFDDLMG